MDIFQFIPQHFSHKKFFFDPDRDGRKKTPQTLGGKSMIGFQQSFELEKRLVVEDDEVELASADARLAKTVVDRVFRKAVVVLSDEKDIGPDDEPLSDKTIDQVIEDALNNGISGIPIFSIGLGDFDTDPLKEMADETGGIFYESIESDNLDTIYEQVAELLFDEQ